LNLKIGIEHPDEKLNRLYRRALARRSVCDRSALLSESAILWRQVGVGSTRYVN